MIWQEFESISPQEIQAYDNRVGFNLVCCKEVGLPIYMITVQALTQRHKPIPPIAENVLKLIDMGLSLEEEIAGVLGLDQSTVRETMINLRLGEDIDLVAPAGSSFQVWALTKKGQRTLREAKVIVPEERTFDIPFDGLLRTSRLLEVSLFKPQELRKTGVVEIAPSPKYPPELSDLKLKDIDHIIRTLEEEKRGKASRERDILALKAIERRRRLLLPATALVYKSSSSDEVQVAFIVDGIRSPEYEEAFARSGSVKKLRIAESLSQSDPRKLASEVLGSEFIAQAFNDHTIDLKKEVAVAEAKIQAQIKTTHEKLKESKSNDEKQLLARELQEAQKQIDELQEQLKLVIKSSSVQYLEVHEHRPHLEKALTESMERLMIVSPWIRAIAVNRLFLQRFEDLLKRNVQIYIGYGFGDKDERRSRSDIQAEAMLKELALKYSETFTLQRWGDTHAKILISDSQFAITTSFNWLSFKGASDRTFRDERGTLVSDSRKVDELYDSLLIRFSEEPYSTLEPRKKKVSVRPNLKKSKKLVLKDVSKPKPQIVRIVHR